MRYQDLILQIRPRLSTEPGAHYRLELRSEPFGHGTTAFELPPTLDLERFLGALEAHVGKRGHSRHVTALDSSAEVGVEPADLGASLFRALFQGDALRLLDRALGHAEATRAESTEELGVCFRFVFDPADAELPELAAVPWELIYRPETGRFLARSRYTPIVRTIAVPIPAPPLRLPAGAGKRVRVLLVEASPTDQQPLDTRAEADAIERALSALQDVDVVRVSHADLGPLHRDHLRRGGFQVVHFMGHGDFVSTGREATVAGEAVLCFERPDGGTHPVPASLFAEHVQDAGTVRLVVLNACRTGALPRWRGQDPFTAAATALVISGIPAVVAMQLPISDRAAVAFATDLYEALAQGDSLSAAVAAGRLAICRDEPETVEWATPVLYLRGDDAPIARGPSEPLPAQDDRRPQHGRPLTGPVEEEAASLPRAPGNASEDRPLRLGIRSLVGFGQGLEARAERILALAHHFEGREIRRPELWHEAVLPALRTFLGEALATERPLVLDLAAHQSLAVAAGRFLEAKSGVSISVVQRGQAGTHEWAARPGEVPEGPLWHEAVALERDGHARDVAAAVSVTHDALPGTTDYLERSALPVRRILHARVHPAPHGGAVRDGAHALRLAQTLAALLRARSPDERRGTLHLFAAAPNSLLLFLGQLSPALGPLQLYEYELPHGPYLPSFLLGGGA